MDKEQEERLLQHKLLEPLVVILGQVDVLLEGLDGQLSEKQKDRLRKIKEYSEKLEKNIRQYALNQGSAST